MKHGPLLAETTSGDEVIRSPIMSISKVATADTKASVERALHLLRRVQHDGLYDARS